MHIVVHLHTLQVGDVLLVDAAGFMFWLAETGGLQAASSSAATSPPSVGLGGDYASFDACVRRTVQLLTAGCGLRLRFFFDGRAAPQGGALQGGVPQGGAPHLKASTTTARMLQRREEWASLQG